MGTQLKIPTTVEDLTSQWLTSALREGGVLAGGSVSAVRHEMLGEGAGFIGQLARLQLTYAGDAGDAPKTMIAKMPALDPGAREIAGLYGLYEREFRFYRDVASEVSFRTARCYYSAGDAEKVEYVLLLEDMGATGAPGDQVAGCTAAHAALALKQLAVHHAQWWNNPRLDAIPWMQPGVDLVNAAMTHAYPNAWEPVLANFREHIADEVAAVFPEFGRRVSALIEPYRDGNLTMTHGDYRLDNMFFGKPGSGYELAVLDWQSPTKAWGAYDVAYFLYSNVDTETRRACEFDVLREYHRALIAGGVTGYDYDTLVDDYIRSLLVSLGIWVVNAATLDVANERGKALFDLFFDRLMAAIMDHDALSRLPA